MSLPTAEDLHHCLLRHPRPGRYWIAYSGGLDSHVLLHLCARLQQSLGQPPKFHAIHVHHGLQKKADDWAEHCASVCGELVMPFELVEVNALSKPGESPEEAARLARYAGIRGLMSAGDIVLTAQHRDDQAETLLLQLMRGAGPAGLAAMPEFSLLEPGFLLRPLLGYARTDLIAYARSNRLDWIEDPSNAGTAYDRNFLRHEIIPRLEARWPGVKKALSRSAGLCAEAQSLLDGLARDMCRSAIRAEDQGLSVARLQEFKPADQRLVLREWMKMKNFRMPSRTVIERILREVLPARQEKTPIVTWREGEIRRYRDGLYLLPPLPPFDAGAVLDWDGTVPLELPGGGQLAAAATSLPGIRAQDWQEKKITVGYRKGGERCRLPGRSGTHELKKLFQEAGIEPWLRERAPLLYLDGELAAVADWWVCEPFAGKSGEGNVVLAWLAPRLLHRPLHRFFVQIVPALPSAAQSNE